MPNANEEAAMANTVEGRISFLVIPGRMGTESSPANWLQQSTRPEVFTPMRLRIRGPHSPWQSI